MRKMVLEKILIVLSIISILIGLVCAGLIINRNQSLLPAFATQTNTPIVSTAKYTAFEKTIVQNCRSTIDNMSFDSYASGIEQLKTALYQAQVYKTEYTGKNAKIINMLDAAEIFYSNMINDVHPSDTMDFGKQLGYLVADIK